MSDDQKKAEGARAYLRNQMNPLVRPLYDSIERDEFVFKGPQGETLALKSGELTPEALSRMATSGYTGSLPLSNPDGGWTEGRLENLKDFSLQELSELPVLKGRSGARVYLQEASQVAAKELGERELEAFGDALARTGSFGLASPSTPIAAFREQQVAEANPLAAAGGALVGTLPFSVGTSALASKAVPALLPMLGGRVAPVGAAALETGAAAAEGTLAARIGAGVADDLAVELVANTQLSLADHALYDEELTAQSLASDIVPNTIFGGTLALGLRGASAAAARALKPKPRTPAEEIFTGPQRVKEFVEEIRAIDDPLEVARVMGDRRLEVVAQASGMKQGAAKAVMAQMPEAEAVARKAGYDVAAAMRGVSDLEGPKNFSGIKSGMSISQEGYALANGALRSIATKLDEFAQLSDSIDAAAYGNARQQVENVRTLIEQVETGKVSPMAADDFIGNIDKLADGILAGVDKTRISHTAGVNLTEIQKSIREGIKHNPTILGPAGDMMARADAAAVQSITAINGMRKYLDKDLNPEALAKRLLSDTASGDAAYIIKHAQDLEDAAKVFEDLGTKEGLEYGARLRGAAANVVDSYAQLFARGAGGLSPYETVQLARELGRQSKDAAGNGLLRKMFDSSVVAAGFYAGAPGLAFMGIAALDAIVGAWRLGGKADKVATFSAARAANSRFFQGVERGREALSKAFSGKSVAPIAGAAGAVGIAAYRNYKTADEKRRAFEDLSKRISELTSDPARLTAELDEGLGPFARLDRAVADEMAMTTFRQAQYLNEILPQVNYGPFAGDMSDSVSDSDVDLYMLIAHTLQQPTDVLHEAAAGTLEPQQVEALRITSPKLYQELVGAALEVAGGVKDLPFSAVSSLSTLVGFPLDPLLEGSFMYHAQNMGAQTQAQDQAINGQGQRRANLPSKSMITQVTRIEGV